MKKQIFLFQAYGALTNKYYISSCHLHSM